MQKFDFRPLGLALLLLTGAAARAQSPSPIPYSAHPDVPASLQIAGLRLELDEDARRLVQQKADALCRHQPSFLARVNLADASFPLIDAVLQREGVPLDFRYLALQESALQGNAESPHGAVGYWQLKQDTALELGLLVNDAVDERRHLTASTRAAARYMLRSNASLQNWLNALLSYYTGLGGVKPYVLPTDAGATTLSLTAATNPYVLMFLAQKIAFEPAIGTNPSPPLRLREFPAIAGQTLAEQAQTIYADPAALAVHNHWLLAPAVPTDGRAYTLIVPITNEAQAAGVLAQQSIQPEKGLLTAPVRNAQNTAEVRVNNLRALVALPGETLADLAGRGRQHLGTFLRHNELTGFDQVVPGRPYYLESKRDAAAVEYHVVAPDETLADVAQRYGIRRSAIMHKNRISHHDDLRPGRVLWLQHTRPHEVAEEYRTLPEGRAFENVAPAPVPTPVAAPPPPTAEPGHSTPGLGADGWPVLPPATPAPAPAVVKSPPARRTPPATPPAAPTPTVDEPVENLNQLPPAPPSAAVPATGAARPLPAPPVRPAAALAPAPRPEEPRPTPAASAKPLPAPAAAALPPALAPAPMPTLYTVQAGETVFGLARRFGLPPANLLAWNTLPTNASLRRGQVLRLTPPTGPTVTPPSAPRPAKATTGQTNPAALYVPKANAATLTTAPVAAPTAAKLPATHTVQAGETCYAIAKRYGLTLTQLLERNHQTAATVRPGDVLRIAP